MDAGTKNEPTSNSSVFKRLGARFDGIPPWRWLVAVALVAGSSTGFAFNSLAAQRSRGADPAVVFLLGKPLALTPQAAKVGVERLRRHVSQLFEFRLPEGQLQRVSFGDLGVAIDKSHLVQWLRDSADRTSPLSRVRRRAGVEPETPIEVPAPLELERDKALSILRSFKTEYDRAPVDARLHLSERRVLPSVEGLLLDLDASLVELQNALHEGRTSMDLVFERTAPERRTEQLTGVRFDAILAAFETPYDRSLRSAARTHNLRVAASKLDGYVLLPGEVFDFNRVVGARDETNGYKVALVIAQGELVDGIGGGTCQISGTLHGAAFFAGLDIVERYPHTRPSSYIKLGLDATVVYPTINFRFRNPYDFPVVLHETVQNGVVRAEILGPPKEITTTLIRRIESATPYDEVERPDSSLPVGRRALAQRGVPGFKVLMYRIKRDGEFATREKWTNRYPPTTQIIRLGTGPETARDPSDDPHPEYTADELLVLTQTPSEKGEPTVTETREPGRYGMAGWTTKAGMPMFERRP